MKKYYLKLIGFTVILVLLIVVEQMISKSSETVQIPIGILNQDIETNQQMTKDMIRFMDVPEYLLNDTMISEINGIEHYYSIRPIKANTILSIWDFSKTSLYPLKENQRLITLKCSILESNGWLAREGAVVDLIMTNPNELTIIKDAEVYKNFNGNLLEDDIPEFASFIVTKEQALDYYEKLDNSHVYILIK